MMSANITPPPPVTSQYIQDNASIPYVEECQDSYYVERIESVTKYIAASPKKIAVKQDSNGKPYMVFAYPQNSFSFDNQIITKLKTSIFFRVKNKKLVNEEWGISCEDFSELGKALARRFSLLSGKAFRNELSQEEKKYWRNIVDDIDYRKYQRDTMAPAYLEATVVKIKPDKITIWVTIEEHYDYITGTALSKCSSLKKGDYISMFFRYNNESQIDDIEKIDLLPVPQRGNRDSLSNIPVTKI